MNENVSNKETSFLDLIEERFSVRKFKSQPVETEKINKILRAGQVAPTACNKQPQRILVINSPCALEKLRRSTMSHFNCPLAFLVCYDSTDCWVREYDGKNSGDVDASIVSTHMMLMAHSLGIGSTWVMHFIPEAIKEEFDLPTNYVPVSILVMGYPDDAKPAPAHSSKKNIIQTVSFNSFK